ncbi:hypothetical protein [Arthrobacter sp.]|uniref:hypothetical protein n=1 Tax=Arthrobacter sp. TaxID=1667 RepID=UPI0026DF2F84|nr:hypothetical protein [Arthrobacter sp.]MDO5751626.1 hypothetical protein [Arthrobacter sp.]
MTIAMSVALAVAAISPLTALPATAATLVFKQDFNSGTLSPFTGTATAPDSIVIADRDNDPGNGVARMTSESATTTETLYRYGTWSGELSLRASFRMGDATHKREAFLMHSSVGGKTVYQTIFTFNPDATVKLLGQPTDLTYSPDKWYDLEATINHTDGTVSAWIDGKQVLRDARMLASGIWESTQSIRFTQTGTVGTTAVADVDDIVASVETGTDLPGEFDGWGMRSHSPTAPGFSFADKTLQIDAAQKTAGSFVKSLPAIPGRTYGLDRNVTVRGAVSSSKVRLVATAYANGRALDAAVPGARVESATITGNTAKSDLFLHLRAPAGADELRFELYFEGPGTASFAPGGEPVENPKWQDVVGDYPSSRIQHPMNSPEVMFGVRSAWTTLHDESTEQRLTAVAGLMSLSAPELTAAAKKANLGRTSLHQHPDIEKQVRRMADLYATTGDENYAKSAITVMTAMADTYEQVPYLHGGFKSWETAVSADVVYAYDTIYHAASWTPESRGAVEDMLRESAVDTWTMNAGTVNNITPYGLKPAAGIAVVLGDPDLLRLFLPTAQTLVSGQWWHSDGLWEEATLSYQDQVLGNLKQFYQLVQANFVDPADYNDTKMGLKLNHTDLTKHYPIFEKSTSLSTTTAQPNGHIIPLNDTWAGSGNLSAYDETSPVLKENLDDIALNGYGFYALTQGDEKAGPYGEATQITLEAPQIARGLPYAGGHSHGNLLGISLWGSGTEALPYVGYASRTDVNRYFQMSASTANAPWVWSPEAEPYGEQAQEPTHASVTGIETGEGSNEKVSFVESSLPGPDGDHATSKRRLVMTVALEGGRSYAVDVSRLKGGQAHQIFLRSSEQEDTDFSSQLPVSKHTGFVKDLLAERGTTYGLADGRDMMTDPRLADGSQDFNFSWTGEDSGTTMHAFMNGVKGDDVIFSTIPTNRRTLQDPAKKNAFPGEHFQRLTKVDPDETTIYGSIYETSRKNQTPLVQSVDWLKAPDGDPNTAVARVKGTSFTDYVYLSDDNKPRTIDGITFSGKVAQVRVSNDAQGHSNAGKTPVNGNGNGQCDDQARIYTYGDTTVRCGGLAKANKTAAVSVSGQVTASTSSNDGTATGGTAGASIITIDQELQNSEDLAGRWMTVKAADGSGWAFKIVKVKGNDVQVEGWLPFERTQDGLLRTFAPFEGSTIAGPVTFSLETGAITPAATVPTETTPPPATPSPTATETSPTDESASPSATATETTPTDESASPLPDTAQDDDLASTGATVLPLALGALILAGAGMALAIAARRKRARH